MEEEVGTDKIETFKEFSYEVENLKNALLDKLNKIKLEDKKIFGYGAPAKGNVLLNYCKIGTNFLEYIIDTTPLKQGLFTPGMHIPVKTDNMISETKSNSVALLLAWNYEKEIMKKESEFIKKGGSFLVPIPIPTLIK